LDPDPWKRWTAHQASMHPFVTGDIREAQLRAREFHWVPPWDPSICHRKLLSVKKAREKKALLLRESISRDSVLANSSKSKQLIHSHNVEGPSIPQMRTNNEILPEVPVQSRLKIEANP